MSKNNNPENEEILDENLEEATVDEVIEEPEEPTPQEKYSELEDRYMRLLAEYDNYKKRTTREKETRYADAVIDTLGAFLPVVDDISRAMELEVKNEEAVKVKEGVELVAKKLKDVLLKLDVEEIKSLGEEFDPNLHNAIMHIEDENVTENTVVEEFMKGYIYKGTRVVRHSVVKVAN